MSILNALQNGQIKSIGTNATVTINAGNGHSKISVMAAEADIDTGCGNQNITAVVSGDLAVDTGHCGYDTINATVGGNAAIVTREDDDNITLMCNGNYDIDAGCDHHECEERGYEFTDNDTVKVISTSTIGQNKISLGKGDDTAIIVSHNVDLTKGEGSLLMGSIGSNYVVNSKATSNVVGFYGDNYDINVTAEESRNDIRTLDFWLRDGQDGIYADVEGKKSLKDLVDDAKDDVNGPDMTLTQYDAKHNAENVQFFKDNFGTMFDTITYAAGGRVEVNDSVAITTNNKAELANKYNLSPKEKEILDKIDLTATYSDGQPLYGIAKSVKKSKDGQPVYVIVKRDGVNHSRAVSDNECIAFKIDGAEKYKQSTTTTTTTTIYDMYATTGVNNLSINMRHGDLNAYLSVVGGKADIKACDALNNKDVRNISVIGGHYDMKYVDTKVTKTTCEGLAGVASGIAFSNDTWTSPLVLDMNHDGKVTAKAGQGVDINNDGKADGAATGGDKMLAMSNFNGNGKIDGNEVFGDQTVSPFTGKKLNAANGFEALKMIAEEAESRGFECIDNGKVNVQKLAVALASVGVSLGLISDNNTSTLEKLTGVSTIDVANYTETAETGAVQNRQHSVYTDENGVSYKVDDVWFES